MSCCRFGLRLVDIKKWKVDIVRLKLNGESGAYVEKIKELSAYIGRLHKKGKYKWMFMSSVKH